VVARRVTVSTLAQTLRTLERFLTEGYRLKATPILGLHSPLSYGAVESGLLDKVHGYKCQVGQNQDNQESAEAQAHGCILTRGSLIDRIHSE
jgi:hypothetical protein